MSNCNDVASAQLCYIPCNFCNIILAHITWKDDCRSWKRIKSWKSLYSFIFFNMFLSNGFFFSYYSQTTPLRGFDCHLLCNTFPHEEEYREAFKRWVHLVNVPCSSLFDMVTVRCGHCSNLWSVNMAAALQPLPWQEQLQTQNLSSGDYRTTDLVSSSSSKRNNEVPNRATNSHNEERMMTRPPEKRQRVPSAYNQFIKEEIQRIKANNPDINHKEAFSTAAKNWAHFPHIHFGLMLESNNEGNLGEGSSGKHLLTKARILNN